MYRFECPKCGLQTDVSATTIQTEFHTIIECDYCETVWQTEIDNVGGWLEAIKEVHV